MKRFLAATIILLSACAQVRDLQGGEKDTTAPVLLNADPPNGSTHFDKDRITLRFSERIKLDRVRDRLLISPPLDKTPEVAVSSGEEVVITLRAALAPNTTYTFNIGEAVIDITEGNAAAGLTYVISTGDVLDSLLLRGTVIDAFTDKPEADALVIMHSDTAPDGFTEGRPAYFTRTDKLGGFVLRNLREGRFHLHALEDQNANFRNDLPNERLAFRDGLVDTRDSLPIGLRMFLPLADEQQVKEAAVQPDRAWRLVLARPAESLSLASIDRTGGTLEWIPERNITGDTILFWPSDTTLLNGQRFTLSDSSGVIDTLTYRSLRKMPFNTDARAKGRLAPDETLFQASRPIARLSADRIKLFQDSVEIPARTTRVEGGGRLFAVGSSDPRQSASALLLLPGAVQDIYGGANDTLRFALGPGPAAQTGDLRVNLTLDSSTSITGPFFLEVLNNQGGVVRTEPFTAFPHSADFAATPAGTYTLKLTVDADGDGRWSTGSLIDRRQPESVFRQQGEVNVRAGWEVVVEWSIVDR